MGNATSGMLSEIHEKTFRRRRFQSNTVHRGRLPQLDRLKILSIDFGDPTESIPAFLCFVGMPFCYSIVEGISLGIISYVVINLLAGNAKKISPMMYVLAVVFIVKYILI